MNNIPDTWSERNDNLENNYNETKLDVGYRPLPRPSVDSDEGLIIVKNDVNRMEMINDDEIPELERAARISADSATGLLGKDQAEVESLKEIDRMKWAGKLDYMLSLVGFAVDLANVWRFPYLCYKNGGGVFLIPYCIFLFMAGVPLFFMELAIGQYNQRGPVTVWNMCPLFKGIGYGMMLITVYVMFYYCVIIAWAVYFIARSITSHLPWTCCGNAWNTVMCQEGIGNVTTKSFCQKVNSSIDDLSYNLSSRFPILMNTTVEEADDDLFKYTPASEFYYREVLGIHDSSGIHDIGVPRWQLALCLFVVMCILCLAISRGIRSSGKVVWVTATLPYITLFILLIRGVTLPGSRDGINFYLNPNITRLRDLEVWTDAATQIFYSLGVGFGVHLTFASYNSFNNNIKLDAIVTSFINCLTSFFSGFVIFSILGYMAKKNGVDIKNVASDGPGLVFVVYPEIISQLPAAPFWACIFFVMLFTLGLDSAMGAMEAIVTGLTDDINFLKRNRLFFCIGLCIFVFCLALINITNGGLYILSLLDMHAAGTSLLFCVLLEACVVSWVYGINRFKNDVREMLGSTPELPWRICWKFISPGFLLFIVLAGIANYRSMTLGAYIYPGWSNAVGWIIAGSSMSLIPLYAVYKMLTLSGSFKQRLAIAITPTEDHSGIMDGTKSVKQFTWKHWTSV